MVMAKGETLELVNLENYSGLSPYLQQGPLLIVQKNLAYFNRSNKKK